MHERAPTIDYHAELKKARKANQRYERAIKSWERLPLRIAGIAIAATTLIHGYTSDVDTNKQRAYESLPELVTISQETEPSNISGVFYLGGFDTISGDPMAEDIGPALSHLLPGHIISIRNGDSVHDPELLGQQIIKQADQDGLLDISLAGNSMDGITMAEVADYISYNSDLPVTAVFMNDTPSGYDGLKPPAQTNLSALLSFVTIFKDSEYSTYAKYLITMVQGIPRFTQDKNLLENIGDFFTVSNETWQDIVNGRRSPMWQVTRQAWELKNSNLQATITHIGQLDPMKKRPVFIIARTTNPADDNIVDVEKSTNDICQYVNDAQLSCMIIFVDGVHHTSYNFDSEAYANAFTNQPIITQKIALEQGRYALQNSPVRWLTYGLGRR